MSTEPIVNLALPLSAVNAVLQALAQTGNTIQTAMKLVQEQAQQQLAPPPVAESLTQVARPDPRPTKSADVVELPTRA